MAEDSESPCSPNEVAIRADDCVEGGVEEWLEDEALAGFRVWQLAGIILSILLSILVGFCCCVRFRVPRTKQEIEADFIRKKITRSFRRELAKISNVEMDDMDLRKGTRNVTNTRGLLLSWGLSQIFLPLFLFTLSINKKTATSPPGK